MLRLTIPAVEQWDEEKMEFISSKETTLQLEHSLVSLSKWESKWQKPFYSKDQRTMDEIIDYVKCMTITKNVPDEVYMNLTRDNVNEVSAYIENPMTATTFNDKNNKKGSNEQITAEIIYYWMVSLQIPMECEKWHLNRLITLIRVCSIKNAPQKKMSKRDILSRNRALNAARKQQLNTTG